MIDTSEFEGTSVMLWNLQESLEDLEKGLSIAFDAIKTIRTSIKSLESLFAKFDKALEDVVK